MQVRVSRFGVFIMDLWAREYLTVGSDNILNEVIPDWWRKVNQFNSIQGSISNWLFLKPITSQMSDAAFTSCNSMHGNIFINQRSSYSPQLFLLSMKYNFKFLTAVFPLLSCRCTSMEMSIFTETNEWEIFNFSRNFNSCKKEEICLWPSTITGKMNLWN